MKRIQLTTGVPGFLNRFSVGAMLLLLSGAAGAVFSVPASSAPWVQGVLVPLVPGQAPNPVIPGGAAPLPVIVTAQRGLAFSATPTVTSSLPAGTSVAFAPAVVVFDGSHAEITISLVVYTGPAAPEGDYPLTIEVAKSDDAGDAATVSSHLSIHQGRYSVKGRLSMQGHTANGMLGQDLEAAGDFNADGYPDVMATDYLGVLGQLGHVYVYFGGPAASATPSLVLSSGVAGDYFGGVGPHGSTAFDVNGDGYTDIVVGASNHESGRGRVYVFYGGPGADTIPDLVLEGSLHGGMFGSCVTQVGDQNGDGYADLLVGVPCDHYYIWDIGHAHLFYGGPGMRTAADVIFSGFQLDDNFGRTAVALGDVNGDGLPDFCIGAFHQGTAYIYFGARPPHTTPDVVLSDVGGNFGGALSLTGDANGDGFPDLYGSEYYGRRGYLYYGGPMMDGLHDLVFPSSPPAAGMGLSMPIGDIDGDGYADFAIGTGELGGALWFYRGGPTVDNIPDFTLYSELPGDGFGNPPARLGNFFGDGDEAFAVSAFTDSRNGANSGGVYVFSLSTSATAQITPQPAATCITPAHACVAVPVTIAREEATPLRAFSVDVQLSGDLSLCPPAIVEGSYLGGEGGGRATSFQVIDRGAGRYTVDCAILGQPCGATAASGTLFTLNLGSGVPSSSGTVSVTSVMLRDCTNGAIFASPGPPASITIDNTAPAPITALAAAQRPTGNDGDGTTAIDLSWPAVEAGASVELYRKGYGNYPEYDDPPGAGAVPPTPGSYPPAGWTLAATVTGATSYGDEVTSRDFWYYAAYVVDPCGNVSPVSNRTSGTLNYHLGDTHNGAVSCQGDNLVNTADLSFLGAHYGATLGDPDVLGCLDVGPTTDYSVHARPTTDNRVDFEDLMMFAINYGEVSGPQLASHRVASGTASTLHLSLPALPALGERFAVGVMLESAGDVKGVSLQFTYDPAVVEPVEVEAGGLLTTQPSQSMVVSSHAGNLDAVLLGSDLAITGSGELARAWFRVRASGEAAIAIARVEARDGSNRAVALGGPVVVLPPQAPLSTGLMAAMPNPFAGATTLAFTLAQGGPVELAIFAVDGRLVRTLVRQTMEPGVYQPTWDGRDDRGAALGPGIYYGRLLAPAGRFTRTLVLMR